VGPIAAASRAVQRGASRNTKTDSLCLTRISESIVAVELLKGETAFTYLEDVA